MFCASDDMPVCNITYKFMISDNIFNLDVASDIERLLDNAKYSSETGPYWLI